MNKLFKRLSLTAIAACLLALPAVASIPEAVEATVDSIAPAQTVIELAKDDIDLTPEEIEEATKLADAGNAEMQCAVGFLYLEGQGVPKNVDKGLNYLEKSAAQGFPEANVILGGLYVIGEVVPEDIAKGKQYLQKAAAAGNEDAIDLLKEIKEAGL